MSVNYDKLYKALYNKVKSRYVGQSGGFKDEADLNSWIGGIGHGAEEWLGRGAIGDTRKDVRTLATLARLRAGQSNTRAGGRILDPNKAFNLGLPDIVPGLTSPFSGYDNQTDLGEFAPKDGESAKDWAARTGFDSAGFTDEELQQMFDGTYSDDPEAIKQKAEADSLAKSKSDILAKMTAFADEMNMPVDQLLQKDEFAKRLRGITFGESMTQSSNRGFGVEGGLSAANADQATKNALFNYQGQRQQAGQAAYGNVYNFLNQQGLQSEDARRYEQGLDLQMQGARQSAYDQRYQQGMGQQSNLFGIAGGVLGGIYGGPAGAAAGQRIGSGIGESMYQNKNPYKPYNYSYPSGTRGGGAGSTRYGGNY